MVALEFTQDRIKLAVGGRSSQNPALKAIIDRPIAGLSDEEQSGAVRDLLSEAGVRERGSLVICIPRHLFTVRNLRLPSSDEAELRQMAALQAGKQLPYPADEIVWDFKVIEKRPDGYSDIILILGHRNVIDRYLHILKNANLDTDRIILSSEALLAWSIAAEGYKSDEEVGGQIRAVVNIDTSQIDVIILKGNLMEFSRSFPFKDNAEGMADELGKTFHSYEKENAKEIGAIILTGIEGKAMDLMPLLEGSKRQRAVEFTHPLKCASIDYRETLSNYFDLSKDISLASLLGICYNPQGIAMNFLPEDVKQRKTKEANRKTLIRIVALGAAVSILLFGILIKGLLNKRSEFKLINLKINETETKVKRLREISQNLENIKQNLDMRGSSVDVIREVFKIVPPGISISVMDFELGKTLTLRGISSDLSSVFKFDADLEKSVYFRNCEIRYAQKRIIKEKEFVDFEINCKLEDIRQ
ncbi:MAG: hypothetical protein PHO42_06695 [Candidatus Omnitrophica bacterium]|nr:hypothetical protein [Candidatus Omnitrophota bacterium]